MPIDPATLRIVHYPDPALRRKASPIEPVTDEQSAVARRMIELMFQAEGVGLAAPQVGLPWRMFVAHVPASEGRSPDDSPPTATVEPQIYINPVISSPVGAPELGEEGCLSLPEITGQVMRSLIITITATDLKGVRLTHTAAGLLARCWQHEIDHLDGVLIIDRMTQGSRLRNRLLIRDLERAGAADGRGAKF
ncbi:MAG: peptide deformylase [Phycisphaerales bacterium]|nr:peptide deformylase [Phycisphaerales bacterium]